MARPFIQKYETASGSSRYRAWYYDGVGRRASKVFHTKREAEAFLKAKAGEEATGTLADSVAGRVSFESVWKERQQREEFAPLTLKSHATVWRQVGPVLGHMPVLDIQPRHIEAVLAKIEKPGMKAKARTILVAVFSYAMAEGRIPTNPAKARRKSRTRSARMAGKASRSPQDRRYLNREELDALLGSIPDRYRMLVGLMARIGLRPGEAYALTVGQIDGARLRIDRTIDGAATKTGESRNVTLPAILVEALTEQVARYSDPTDPEALVFPNRNGGMLRRDSFRQVFQRAAIKAGINHGFSPNDLRHTAVSFAIAHDANVYDVQRMLGHAKPSITLDVYGDLWDESPERLAKALDAAIREERLALPAPRKALPPA